jgi:hypothetical protein
MLCRRQAFGMLFEAFEAEKLGTDGRLRQRSAGFFEGTRKES